MRRARQRAGVLVAVAVAASGMTATGAAAQSCTGQLIRQVAPASVPFGTTVVAPTARTAHPFGQVVISPEATAPHDACPAPPGAQASP